MTISKDPLKYFAFIAFCLSLNHSYSQEEVPDPISESIGFSDLTVFLQHFATIPKAPNQDLARINMLKELPDGSGRYAVNDLNGILYLVDSTGTVTEFLDLKSHFDNFRSSGGKGMGFGAFAFHPEFSKNGIFYTSHSEDYDMWPAADFPLLDGPTGVQWVLTRWTTNSDTQFNGMREELSRWDFVTRIHGIQDITFNPLADEGHEDYGKLYICVGDGGASSKAYFPGNYQTLESHTGTIFRIDPEGTNSVNGKYGIPADNPYMATENALGEIWAYGFRNPHRILFDNRSDGEVLLATDIGELNLEEVNLIVKGGNYGWNKREGTFQYIRDIGRDPVFELPEKDDETFLYPVAQYDHDEGDFGSAAINTGYVWRAESSSSFKGQLFMGDIPSGKIFHAPVDSLIQGRQYPLKQAQLVGPDGVQADFYQISSSDRPDIKFGYDSKGRVYFLTKADGKIYRISDNGTIKEEKEEEVLAAEDDEVVADKIYPTLPSSTLKIELIKDAKVSLITKQGQIVWQVDLRKGNYAIPLPNLKKGIYFVWITRNGYSFTQKIIR